MEVNTLSHAHNHLCQIWNESSHILGCVGGGVDIMIIGQYMHFQYLHSLYTQSMYSVGALSSNQTLYMWYVLLMELSRLLSQEARQGTITKAIK